jgi:dTDP-4-amino-4,6-dideoxygalactose transaminase
MNNSNDFKIAAVMQEGSDRIVLFRPNVPERAAQAVKEVLESRWIGQGPKVEQFENIFNEMFGDESTTAISCGSGTDALHLAYLLAGVEAGDEVICPIFTCTATNMPALYIGAKVIFADIEQDTMNISVQDVRAKITPKTKAIIFVDYGGVPANLDGLKQLSKEFGIPLIEDAAHALGAKYKGKAIGSIADFTTFSFQAIKHITTGDGGMVMVKDPDLAEKAKKLRWFGIDRQAKFKGIWENDITEIGFKYQMNDIAAAIGIEALKEFNKNLELRKDLMKIYQNGLSTIPELAQIGAPYSNDYACWLHTINVPDPISLQAHLFKENIESGQVHFRNDRYSIFGGRRVDLPNMDLLESRYLVLPLHTHMNGKDVERVVGSIKNFFRR